MIFSPILKMTSKYYRKAFDSIMISYYNAQYNLMEIWGIEKSLPQTFSIDDPSITFSINGSYDRNLRVLSIEGTSAVETGQFDLKIEDSREKLTLSDNSVIHFNRSSDAAQDLSSSLLLVGDSEYSVSWYYDTSKITESEDMDHGVIPSYLFASSVFYTKNKDSIIDIHSNNRVIGSDSIVVAGDMINLGNRVSSSRVETYAKTIVHEDFSMLSGGEFSTDLEFSYYASNISFGKSSVNKSDRLSVVAIDSIDNDAMKLDLSNATSIMLSSIEDEDVTPELVVTDEYLESKIVGLLGIDSTEIMPDSRITSTTDTSACDTRRLVSILRVQLEEYYVRKIRDSISGSGDGSISEMYQYIDGAIKDMINKYLSVNECLDAAPINTDEGCDIKCESIDANKGKMMVSKQKLKAMVLCELKCTN